ncbi:class I adenylate-forming enzyme family protein [Bradyrhizobium sp. SYSU BS000235]|uniref:class I adenylate-forming enzyme family protein n=1 Tax=Bradyrhizobium sp. SYSU BS000235 TaxID=3411332 RepID=UPI003C7943AB
MDIVTPIFRQAATQGNAPAVTDHSLSLSYSDLQCEVTRLADYLRSLGIVPGDRVMMIGENSVALAVLILAGSHAGATIVLENARRAPLEIDAITTHCQPKRAIFVLAHSTDARKHAEQANADIRSDAVIGDFAVSAESPKGSSASDQDTGLAAFIYTTGTTGTPKGVMLTHGNLCFIASMMGELREIASSDKVYCVLPITHVMGLASVLLGSLHSGAHVHLRPRFSARECLADINALGITVLQGATAMFAKLTEQAHLDKWQLAARMRFMGAGGAPIDTTVKRNTERLFGVVLQNGYGLTEAASICWTRFDETYDDDSVGRPLPGMELRILDDNGHAVADDTVGELWALGPNVMRGYFRNPEMTEKVLTVDGWLNTQDLARRSPDGRIYIVGRKKDVIIRSGFKVNPLEVETILNRHPGIAHSAVIGRKAEGNNEDVVAFVELVQPLTALPDDLERHLRNALSAYKYPNEIIVLPALPLAPNGKVLKNKLLETAKGLT